ncbi:amidohydrolase [Kocuria rhizophila]|uniref:amidohydrolase n=1 Tax=Kocuria rhizophila TaxID=72000 RepID=UPI003D6F149E
MRKLNPFDSSAQSIPRLVVARVIHTMDRTSSTAKAMLTHRGRILAIGSLTECEAVAARKKLSPERIELGDAVVVPGFVDPHSHPLMYGQMMTWVDCGPERARSIPQILALLKAAQGDMPPGRPVRGYGYEQRNLAEKRHPTRFELDEVSSDREVYLMNASGHGGVVNSCTLKNAGVDHNTPDPEGGCFFRDSHGDLTGEISDAACNLLTGVYGVKIGHHGPNFHLADEPEEHLRQLDAASQRFLAGGVTSLGDCQVTRREFDMYLRLAETGRLDLRVSMYLLSHLLDETLEMGMVGQFGNAHLSFAGIKFYADGTLGGWTAYFPDGYVGDPCRTGQLYHAPQDYAALIAKAHAAGLQTATHAQSPAAIEMVISAIEAALVDFPDSDSRHRIEHCGLPTPDQIRRMAASGIRPVNQTQHYYNWGEGVEEAIGTPGERFNPLGEFELAGVPITLSSDAPVADPIPLEAIQTAVTRVTRRGHQLGSDSLRISASAALRAHTYEGAVSLGRENDFGSLEVDKYADFAVLSDDPLSVPADSIADIVVDQTWVDGERRYLRSP